MRPTYVLVLLFLTCWALTPVIPSNALADDSKLAYQADSSGTSQFAVGVAKPGLPDGLDEASLLAGMKLPAEREKRLAWFTYGDAHSRSIAIMTYIDDPDSIFVDLDRDKVFSKREQLTADDGKWNAAISAEFVQGQNRFRYRPLQAQISWNDSMERFELQTLGAMVGTAAVDGQPRAAKYIDHNSNGCWFDPEDRLLVDVDGDGKLNRITERFACRALCRIKQKQYAIGGDKMGQSMVLNEITERGTIIPKLTLSDEKAEIVELSASVASKSGIYLRVEDLTKPIQCPVGEYHVESVKLKAKTETGVYDFRFAANEAERESVRLDNEGEVQLELLGDLKLVSSQLISQDGRETKLSIMPTLTAASGLYLFSSRSGKTDSTNDNRLTTVSVHDGLEIDLGSSGFS